MLLLFIKIVHIAACFFMIAVILLQSGKGAEMGASFGTGGSQSVFGAGGGTTFITKLTVFVAVTFFLTSMLMTYLSGTPSSSSIMSTRGIPVNSATQPVQNAPAAPASAPTHEELPDALVSPEVQP